MSEVIDFATLARIVAATPKPPRATLHVVEQSPAGTHDFPPVAPVDVTGGVDGMRLWINGRAVFEGSATAVLRLKSAADVFEAHGLLHLFRTPEDVVRAMLRASVAEYPEGAA